MRTFNLVTLERPSPAERPLQDKLNDALVRELLFRARSAGPLLIGVSVLLWLVIAPPRGALADALFVALAGLALMRLAGSLWLERRDFSHPMRVFWWFAGMSLGIGLCLGTIVLTTYGDMTPIAAAMCAVSIVGINSVAMISLASSPLIFLLYVGGSMLAMIAMAFVHPVAGFAHPFQAMQIVYSAALIAVMRSVHRSLRNNILLRLQLADSLAELRATQAKLVEASRLAGRADVATTVIHNVGNVLNSVNVSAEQVAGLLARSRAGSLAQLAALIDERRADLAAFFRDDPRGQHLPAYLAQLAAASDRERAQASDELARLARNIDHIKKIVRAQQAHVRARGAVEPVDVRALLDDALRFNAASYDAAAIEIVRDVGELPTLQLDRHNVLQIVVNLLANARDAVRDNAGARRIAVSARRDAAGRLAIAVDDNGCGIAEADLERMFSLGFTTKPDGHGLGLHFSACVARELDGELTAHSAGADRGARFVLTLPLITTQTTSS